MSIVLMASNQNHHYPPDGYPPMMPGQTGYPAYLSNQPQSGEPSGPANYNPYGLISHQNPSIPQHLGYHYMGAFPPHIPQSSSSQAFVSSAAVNADVTSTAPAYAIPERGSTFTPGFMPPNRSVNPITTPTISPSRTQFEFNDAARFHEESTGKGKGRCDSLYPKEEASSPTSPSTSSTPRRRSEYAEPGSARAIYLEKNRKAASKCRSKQKMEQEDLVERSRLMERTNRLLKLDVDALQAQVRQLKELAGRHADCRDQRITDYLQRQADQLSSKPRIPSQGFPPQR